MRTTPHTRLRKPAFELHFGREPNTEWSNMLKLDKTKSITDNFISARPDTLQVYTFSGEGGSSDHLPMKQKRKGAKTVIKYPFQFFERKNQKEKFESPYSENLQTAVTGTKHTMTTSDNKIFHRKLISKPNITFEQEPTEGRAQEDQTGDLPENNINQNTPPKNPHQKKIWTPAQNRPPLNGQAQSAEDGHGQRKKTHRQTIHRANKTIQELEHSQLIQTKCGSSTLTKQ